MLSKLWLFPLLKHELHGRNFERDAQVIQETQFPKEEFEVTIKKLVERMEACLVANGWYFKKENVKCTA